MKRTLHKTKIFLKTLTNNRLLTGFLLMAISNDFLLRFLTVDHPFKIKPILTSTAIMLILSAFIILLTNKRRNYFYLIFAVFISVLNTANYMYHTHFNSYISIGIIRQIKHLGKMQSSFAKTLDFKMMLFLIPISLYYYLYKKIQNSEYHQERNMTFSLKNEVVHPLMIGLMILGSVSLTLTGTDIGRLISQWNREYLVSEFGIYTFSVADFIKLTSVPRIIKADYKSFDDKMVALVEDNNRQTQDNKYTNILENKDLYVIHYESVQNFAMDLAFGDGEVTPFLNKLSKESLFFENFYPQHSVGTSSDSEFTFAASLYPINNRTVFIDHAGKEFETLQKLLLKKGYHTMSMHGNNGGFWNRNIMHPNLGYNEFISKEDFVIDEEIGLGLSDVSFYSQSIEIIKNRKESLKKPLMATIISLSNHYPFNDLDVYGDFDTGYLEGTKISNYLKSMRYADYALQQWFEEMNSQGLLDNAAVLIYGDHHAQISKDDYELIFNSDVKSGELIDIASENYANIDNAYLKQVQKTPLIIWTKDHIFNERVSQPIGMIDVMPTIGNMLNIENQYQLGEDIFNIDENQVIFPDGSFLDRNIYYNSSNLTIYNMGTNEVKYMFEEFDDYIFEKIKKVEKVLELSSTIIENNLIKYYKELSD